jgi:hypothetical protein
MRELLLEVVRRVHDTYQRAVIQRAPNIWSMSNGDHDKWKS